HRRAGALPRGAARAGGGAAGRARLGAGRCLLRLLAGEGDRALLPVRGRPARAAARRELERTGRRAGRRGGQPGVHPPQARGRAQLPALGASAGTGRGPGGGFSRPRQASAARRGGRRELARGDLQSCRLAGTNGDTGSLAGNVSSSASSWLSSAWFLRSRRSCGLSGLDGPPGWSGWSLRSRFMGCALTEVCATSLAPPVLPRREIAGPCARARG